jgi:uncharacterized repeat protein (TIGR03837 family)
MPVSCDLFCAVVDNLGDAGVCWRLARQLAAEHGWAMRLWIDDMAPLALLRPGIDPLLSAQTVDGVEIHRWSKEFPAVEPARVVIEAFGCELPPGYLVAMTACRPPPLWLNLEYLSAEDWVAGCHALPSPHPTLPLTKYFFFPGFTAGTGGLIRERDFGVPPVPQERVPFRVFPPVMPTAGDPLTLSLFCYDNPALPHLLDSWAHGSERIACRVTDGLPRRQVEQWLGAEFSVGATAQRGQLSLIALPFLPQIEYDALLGGCDLNFVRGEDSFVRAQWAEQPFVWQPYPQSEDTHRIKLAAFLQRYLTGLDAAASSAVRNFWQAWNGEGDIAATWSGFRAALPPLAAHGPAWSKSLRNLGDLAENIANFCSGRL